MFGFGHCASCSFKQRNCSDCASSAAVVKAEIAQSRRDAELAEAINSYQSGLSNHARRIVWSGEHNGLYFPDVSPELSQSILRFVAYANPTYAQTKEALYLALGWLEQEVADMENDSIRSYAFEKQLNRVKRVAKPDV